MISENLVADFSIQFYESLIISGIIIILPDIHCLFAIDSCFPRTRLISSIHDILHFFIFIEFTHFFFIFLVASTSLVTLSLPSQFSVCLKKSHILLNRMWDIGDTVPFSESILTVKEFPFIFCISFKFVPLVSSQNSGEKNTENQILMRIFSVSFLAL